MLYLTCTMISSVDLAHYEVSRAKDWVSLQGEINYLQGREIFYNFVLYKVK